MKVVKLNILTFMANILRRKCSVVCYPRPPRSQECQWTSSVNMQEGPWAAPPSAQPGQPKVPEQNAIPNNRKIIQKVRAKRYNVNVNVKCS